MVDLKKDEKTVEVIDENKIIITRVMVEEYETDEFCRTYFKLEQQIEQLKAQLEETEKLLNELSENGIREKVEANDELIKERNKKKREEDLARLKQSVQK